MSVDPDSLPPTLDRVSPVPLYFQIEQALADEIRDGRWAPGFRLPSEPALADHFGVSRSVIRQALVRLERGGFLARRRGIGAFVAQPKPPSWQLQGAEGFFEDEVARLGRDVVSQILRTEIEPLPLWAARSLEVVEGAPGVALERLRYVDGLLAVYDLNFLHERYADAVMSLKDDPRGSLYEALRRMHGVGVAAGERSVDAILASRRLAELLEIDERVPLLFVEGVDLDENARPFDCYRTWLRPDRLKIQVKVVPPAPLASSVSAQRVGELPVNPGGRA